ncbi:mucin-2-like [Hylaeus volcanicus]|uniref:mucin-2-like n=1 Tax=Hylaeus volcanicus TaxID=313075 RepID=UPI0023B79C3D|nr:mucin-2-like [Hylaeus volcanicus]XP_053970249.1 mucin-2-like [Hylaeus volcanicus]
MARTMQLGPWAVVVALVCVVGASSEFLMGGHMDNSPPKSLLEEMESSPALARTAQLDDLDLDLDAEESTVAFSTSNEDEALRYHLPYPFAFNGGRPFSLEKDPITGKIDFEKAPPVKALNYTSRYQEHPNDGEKIDEKESSKEDTSYTKKIESKETVDVSPNEINPYSPNFHDFLNLPVQYSSDKYGKDKYPLISSSYANTKVQSGSNSYSTYNHKPYHGETVLYYPTRKPYVPKATAPVITSPRTTPSTTTTTTSTTTTPRTTMTTTTTTTTTTTPPPTTTSTKAPVVTTWKPRTTTPKRFMDALDDYEDILPIEKLQASMYGNNHRDTNDIVHNRDPQAKPPVKQDEYIDGYEDYEIEDEEDTKDYVSMKESTNEIVKTSTLPTVTSTVSNITTTTRETTTPASTTTTTSTPASSSMTPTSVAFAPSSSKPQESTFAANPLVFQGPPHRPVTSMPLDNDHRVPAAFENDNKRHGAADNVIVNQGYRPNSIANQRPSGLGGGILVESTSNIVIPPDQDTVSFILGNRQNVEGGYYSLGTAIGENLYGSSTGIGTSFRPLYGLPSDKTNYDPQDHHGTIGLPSVSMLDSNPIYAAQTWRHPSSSATQKLANEIEPTRSQNSFVMGTVLLEQPDDKKDDKNVNYVVFRTDEPKQPVEEHIVVVNEADGTVHEITSSSTTIKPARIDPPVPNEEHLPQLSENLTPPAERPRPPPQFYYHYHHGGTARPDHPRPQRPPLPLPPRGKQPLTPPPPPPPSDLSIRRRPYSPDANLPNILPQFRPNAKTSHGHRGSETIGTIPASQSYPPRVRQPVQSHPPTRRPLPPPPSYLQRLNPPPPPIHALRVAASTKSESVVPPMEIVEPTVKRFRLPQIPATSRGDDEVKSAQRLSSQKLRLEEEERLDRYSEEPPQVPPRPPLYPKRRTADPPHVATLQMLQHHGELDEDITESNLSSIDANEGSEGIVTDQEADRRKFDERETMAEPPVYVVYPVNTAVNIHPDDSREKDESVVVGTRGPHRPLPPETLLQDSVEQNDNEHQGMNEEQSPPIHGIFGGRPMASDFPYPLERPDPSILVNGMRETPLLVPSDQRQDEQPVKETSEEKADKDTSVNVIPYLQDFVPFPARKNEAISATLHRSPALPSSTPIAYVYTPTAQASHRLDVDVRDEGTRNDSNEQKPVLLPSQQPSSSSSSAPSPQNFMAPFVASVSAEAPSKNGWSVVVVEPTINRKSDDDHGSSEDTSDAEESQTEKNEFDPENFKPQLFGGFKPIYEFPTEDVDRLERRESVDTGSEVATHLRDSADPAV